MSKRFIILIILLLFNTSACTLINIFKDTDLPQVVNTVAAQYHMTEDEKMIFASIYKVFFESNFAHGTSMQIASGEQDVKYTKPFIGPGGITPKIILGLSKATQITLGVPREIVFYKLGSGSSSSYIVYLSSVEGGPDPDDTTELIIHNHPGGTKILSQPRSTETSDCDLLFKTRQDTTILATGPNDDEDVGKVEYELIKLPEGCRLNETIN